jgi:hypothetical protein
VFASSPSAGVGVSFSGHFARSYYSISDQEHVSICPYYTRPMVPRCGSACSQQQKWLPGSRPVWRCSAKGFDRLPCAHRRENPLYINNAREKRVLTHNAMLPNLTSMPIAVVVPRTDTNRNAIANELINNIWALLEGVKGGYKGNVIQIWMAKPGTPSNLPQCTISSLMTLQMTAFQQWSVEFLITITSADGNVSGKNMKMSIDLRSLVIEVQNFLEHGRSSKNEIVLFVKYMNSGQWFTKLYDKKQKLLQDGPLDESNYSLLKKHDVRRAWAKATTVP